MLPDIKKIKGIHPGAILKREIKMRGIKNKDLALLISVQAQAISAILKEKRRITPGLSIKLGTNLGVDSDYFMLLQASYDVKKVQSLSIKQLTPNLKNIRKVLFWDADFNKIDWEKNRKAIIKRIFERGNRKEIDEIINFYGFEKVKNELYEINASYLPSFEHNVNKYVKNR
jgi:addiction module HigA family antidote